MPGTTVGQSMNLGFPGTFSRNGDCVIEAYQVRATDAAGPNFGDVVVDNLGTQPQTLSSLAAFIAAGGTFTAALFGGIAVREVKSFLTYQPTPQFSGYLPGDYCDAIKRGSVSVKCNVGAPTPKGPVYVRTVYNNAIPAGIVGGIEAAADGANTVLLPNVVWQTGLIDGNAVSEITIMTRQI